MYILIAIAVDFQNGFSSVATSCYPLFPPLFLPFAVTVYQHNPWYSAGLKSAIPRMRFTPTPPFGYDGHAHHFSWETPFTPSFLPSCSPPLSLVKSQLPKLGQIEAAPPPPVSVAHGGGGGKRFRAKNNLKRCGFFFGPGS